MNKMFFICLLLLDTVTSQTLTPEPPTYKCPANEGDKSLSVNDICALRDENYNFIIKGRCGKDEICSLANDDSFAYRCRKKIKLIRLEKKCRENAECVTGKCGDNGKCELNDDCKINGKPNDNACGISKFCSVKIDDNGVKKYSCKDYQKEDGSCLISITKDDADGTSRCSPGYGCNNKSCKKFVSLGETDETDDPYFCKSGSSNDGKCISEPKDDERWSNGYPYDISKLTFDGFKKIFKKYEKRYNKIIEKGKSLKKLDKKHKYKEKMSKINYYNKAEEKDGKLIIYPYAEDNDHSFNDIKLKEYSKIIDNYPIFALMRLINDTTGEIIKNRECEYYFYMKSLGSNIIKTKIFSLAALIMLLF